MDNFILDKNEVLLAVIYRSDKKQDGFVRHFSRGAFMRDLAKTMEGKNPEKVLSL